MVSATAQDGGRLGQQLEQVGRLVDTMEVGDVGTSTVVRMLRRLPLNLGPLTATRLDEMRSELAAHVPGTALDELAVQNQQLMMALDEVQAPA